MQPCMHASDGWVNATRCRHSQLPASARCTGMTLDAADAVGFVMLLAQASAVHHWPCLKHSASEHVAGCWLCPLTM